MTPHEALVGCAVLRKLCSPGLADLSVGAESGSESDSSIQGPSNRGNKLKRKARFVHEGQMDGTIGPRAYKRRIEHAGYERNIISRNPLRYDEFGDELEDEDVDDQADAAAAEENPYSGIKIESLLAPLTSAAGLATHPTLSLPYYSSIIPTLSRQASDMVHQEKALLSRMKLVLTKFRGDEPWMPAGALVTENDSSLFGTLRYGLPFARQDSGNVGLGIRLSEGEKPLGSNSDTTKAPSTLDRIQKESLPSANLESASDWVNKFKGIQLQNHVADHPMGNPEQHSSTIPNPVVLGKLPNETMLNDGSVADKKLENVIIDVQEEPSSSETFAIAEDADSVHKTLASQGLSSSIKVESENIQIEIEAATTVQDLIETTGSEDVEGSNKENEPDREDISSQPAPHRMTTRAQALAASDPTISVRTRSSSLTPSYFVHPMFTVPHGMRPDPDFGLPPLEAEETRRLLLLWVQKQEEVCRGAEKLQEGLITANRMRKMVLRWCKAEAHLGEMSDGEDWYDKEEWGLDDDLGKGKEETEEEAKDGGKKTRARRQ
ncbi:MAG: hypothetical protein M1829_000694 [Trizodia sp. TS-e1964]|nr:MAG: hypothetical protein M1829_000694 [Trizodia sp. TS-e1964]